MQLSLCSLRSDYPSEQAVLYKASCGRHKLLTLQIATVRKGLEEVLASKALSDSVTEADNRIEALVKVRDACCAVTPQLLATAGMSKSHSQLLAIATRKRSALNYIQGSPSKLRSIECDLSAQDAAAGSKVVTTGCHARVD